MTKFQQLVEQFFAPNMRSIFLLFFCFLFLASCSKDKDEQLVDVTPLSICREDMAKQAGTMTVVKDLIAKTAGKKQEYFAAKILAGRYAQYREYILLMNKGEKYFLITDSNHGKVKRFQLKKDEYHRLKKDLNIDEIRNFDEDQVSYISAHSHCSFFELKDKDGVRKLAIPSTHGRILEDEHETLEERIIKITRHYDSTYTAYSYDDSLWSSIMRYFGEDELNATFYELH